MRRATCFAAAFVASVLMLVARPGAAEPAIDQAQPALKQVLMLQSLDRGALILDQFTGDFRVGLDRRAGRSVNVVQIVVGPTGFIGASDQAVVDYIQAKYEGRPRPDLIVSAGGPAAVFARNNRARLFPETPLLFASVDQRFLRGAPLGDNESAVPVSNDFPRLVDDILHVLPETRQVFMVIGSGALGEFWRRELEAPFARFRDRVTFVWSDELSHADILRHCATLPRDSAIIYLAFGTDAEGGAYADKQVIADLHKKANAPLFSAFTPVFGSGIVGGSMMSIGDAAEKTAEVASRILDGAPAAGFRLAPQLAGRPMFDWRELQRWNIPESRLPPGSIVRFRAPGLWEQYGRVVLVGATVLLLQALLIASLLVARRARQRAEIDSRRSLTLAADANRRETMATLATSIGHELGQPLSAIVHSAQALQMMMVSDPAGADATAEIVQEIHAEAVLATQIVERHRSMLRSHELHKQPLELRSVVDESLALVAHDMRTRQVEVILALSTKPCLVEGDPVLLKQVLVNLFRNAIDAMDGMPPAQRRLTIQTAVMSDVARLWVIDTGPGLPAGMAGTLFEPFVTTKTQGLGIGLAIAQRLVDAHGGTLVARNNADGGAAFTITLPRNAAAPLPADPPVGASAPA